VQRTHLTISILTAAALCAAGCGEEEGTPSKAEFIKRADAICRHTDQTILVGLRNFTQRRPGAEGLPKKVIATVALPAIQKEAEEIGSLAPPAGDEQKLRKFVSEIEAGVKEAEQGDVERTFNNDHGTFRRVNKLGTAYGFNACNEPL
jgi:hypothetical protein